MFWDYAKAVGLWITLAICVLYTGQSAAAVGANMWLSAWTNEATAGGRQNNTSLRLGVYATLGMLQGDLPSAWGSPGCPLPPPPGSQALQPVPLPQSLPNPPATLASAFAPPRPPGLPVSKLPCLPRQGSW